MKKRKNAGATNRSESPEIETSKMEEKSNSLGCGSKQEPAEPENSKHLGKDGNGHEITHDLEQEEDHHITSKSEPSDIACAFQLISDFAHKCILMPDCKANALRALGVDYLMDEDIEMQHHDMPDSKILSDAKTIIDTMVKLSEDYAGEHDHANKVLDEIMSHHAPLLQQWLDHENKLKNALENENE